MGGVALILSMSDGSRYAFGVFLKPMVDEFQWSRAGISLAASVNLMLGGLLQPLVGYLVDRFGGRAVVLAGSVIAALSLGLLSFASQPWQVFLVYGVLHAAGSACMSSVVAAKLVSRWFVRRRGISLAASMSSVAIGQLVVVPLATWMMLQTSWQLSIRLLGGVLLVLVVPTGLLFVRNTPQEVGLTPDGSAGNAEAGRGVGSLPQDRSVRLVEAMRTLTFWQIVFGFVVCGFTMSFVMTHFVAFATDMGIHEMGASGGLSIAGAFSIVGALLCGYASDRYGRRLPLAFTYFLRGLGFVALLWSDSLLLLYLSATLIGLSWTSTVPLGSVISADTYGERSLGLVFGTMFATMWLGSAIGAYLDGLAYDMSGSYTLALLMNASLGFAAALVTLTLREREPVPVLPHRGVAVLSGAPGGS